MSSPYRGFRRPPNPVTQAAFRRQVRLEIYLPIGLTLLGLIILVAVVIALGYGSASSWADAALVFLSVPLALLLLVVTAALAGAIYLMVRLIREIPPVTSTLQDGAGRLAGAVHRGSEVAVQPVIIPSAVAAALAEAGRSLRALFRADEAEK
ncbi:MAG TPA: hypothetical protein VK449_08480 [Anaerolineales bacterium]|nr:hypothetical protein [Anaerolineales bacterium]